MESKLNQIVKQSHHERANLCTTRPSYRQGKKLTAVKVYTVNDESQHLLIRGVPAINLQKELKHLCLRYGDIKLIHAVKDYSEDEEPFTEVFHVLFAKIQAARFAKHMLDDKSFFGGVLHVCYAPELETLAETKHKIDERRHEVLKRLNQYNATELRKAQHNQSGVEAIPGCSGLSSNYQAICSASSARVYQYKELKPENSDIVTNLIDSITPSFQPESSISTSDHPRIMKQSHKPQVPINTPPSLAEAGVIAQQFIPRLTPKPNLKSNTSLQTDNDPISSKPNEQFVIKRNSTSKFIPPQVKRIKFN